MSSITRPTIETRGNPEFCTRFYDHLAARPPNTWVWLGRYDPPDSGVYYRNRFLWPQAVGIVGPARGFISVLAFRQVLFIVYMHSVDRQPEVKSRYIRPLMPSRGMIAWPPVRAADYETFKVIPEM
ncbi:MAG: hypothetical protein ACRDQZ_26380, partial [Mycobacteriales bacterium]